MRYHYVCKKCYHVHSVQWIHEQFCCQRCRRCICRRKHHKYYFASLIFIATHVQQDRVWDKFGLQWFKYCGTHSRAIWYSQQWVKGSNTVTDHIAQTSPTAATTTQADTVGNVEKLEGEGVWRSLTVLCLCISFIVLILVALLYVGVAVYIARRKVNHCHNGCCNCESKGGKGDTSQITNLLTDKETTSWDHVTAM